MQARANGEGGVKYLIVNADDFGASFGINRGIVEAHVHGIVTSASVMVDMPASEDAAALAGDFPALSLGLHVDVSHGDPRQLGSAISAELDRQTARFQALLGRLPSHVDSHLDLHDDPRLGLLPEFLALSRRLGVPLRRHAEIRHIRRFYGQWDGVTHLEQISVESLVGIVREEAADGVSELTCHPGYVNDDFRSSYHVERETEVRTLCDPRTATGLADFGIRLTNFGDLPHVTGK